MEEQGCNIPAEPPKNQSQRRCRKSGDGYTPPALSQRAARREAVVAAPRLAAFRAPRAPLPRAPQLRYLAMPPIGESACIMSSSPILARAASRGCTAGAGESTIMPPPPLAPSQLPEEPAPAPAPKPEKQR